MSHTFRYAKIGIEVRGMLDLIKITKDYYVDKKPVTALKGITVSFGDTGLVAILGHSGCGKTTTLNIIGGLDHYTDGDLLINGKSTKEYKDADWDAYRNEQVGFVFQSYNLIPHSSIIANVETPLLLNGVPRKARREMAENALHAVGLEGQEKKKPNQLSGGQMQRVAIARAIVNNPKIILADEPTGALDSGTSIQIMDILKKMSETRLVIMVTHNGELAERYADRIIKMKDGEIVSDTAPIETHVIEKQEALGHKKTSMSFFTALRSSFQNIRTKKARTILTSVASSIGLIGVALVLSVSNGFSNYISNVETSLASSVPITISKTTYTYQSNNSGEEYEKYPTDDNLRVYDTSSTQMISHTNYYTEEYVENVINPLVNQGLARSVMINRQNLDFNLIKKVSVLDENGNVSKYKYKGINQYSSASGTISSAVSSVTYLPATIFHEVYGDEKGLDGLYDVVYGKFPTESNELVLITDEYNRVEASTLRKLGIIDEDDETTKNISFANICQDTVYKAYLPSDYYQVNSDPSREYTLKAYKNITPSYDTSTNTVTYTGEAYDKKLNVYTIPQENEDGYKEIYEDDAKYNPIELKIVGVVRPSKDAYLTLMPNSIGYLPSLKDRFVEDANKNCSKLHDVLDDCWYMYNDNGSSNDSLKNLGDAMTSLIKSISASTTTDAGSISTSSISSLAQAIYWRRFYGYPVGSSTSVGQPSYSSFFTQSKWVGKDYREDLVGKIIDKTTSGTDEEKKQLSVNLMLKFLDSSFYDNGHAKATYDLDCDIMNIENWDFNIVDLIAYFQSYSLITSILIFPYSLTTKETLKTKLDAYNDSVGENKKIIYSDIMSSFTSTLGTMIDLISVVLVVFASISLVVSSIMTAIITYVSVIERTKEIGVIRACGGRKKDVGRLFQAECVIIGLGAGLIGIITTYILDVPISYIISRMYPDNGLENIASLNPLHALALVAIAVLLAFVSGLIPSRIGAKKDPVECLRSE